MCVFTSLKLDITSYFPGNDPTNLSTVFWTVDNAFVLVLIATLNMRIGNLHFICYGK